MPRNEDRDDDRPRRSRGDDRDDEPRSRGRGRDDDGPSTRRTSTASAAYEYHGRTREDVERRSSMGAGDYDRFLSEDVKQWKPADGDNTIRAIQAFWDDPKNPGRPAPHYGLDVWVHYGVGPDRQSYLCPVKHNKGACPICEERDRVVGDDEEYAKQLAPKRRVLFWLIDRDHEREGPQAWASPWTVDRDISKISMDKRTGEVLSIDHAFEGYDIEFEKKGSKNRTEYLGVSVARRSSELGDDRWLEYAKDNPLPEKLVFYDYDVIARSFGGGGEHKSKRDEDRGREGGRDRDSGRSSRGRDDDDRGRSRDDDRGSRSSRDNRDAEDAKPSRRSREPEPTPEPELTWESVHGMTGRELEDLIEQEKLKITADDAKDDDELADWICEDLKLSKAARRRATPPAEDKPDDDPKERLRKMRESRGDR